MVQPASSPVPTVLLVGSRQDDRVMYEEYLRTRGFNVVVAENGHDALKLAEDVNAVVTSVRLPGDFDGIELVRRLRGDRRIEAKAIIVLTASSFTADREAALAAGCDAFLLKPCLPDTLLAAIRRAISSRSRTRPRATLGRRPRHKRRVN